MGSRNPERDRPSIDPSVRLLDFVRTTGGDWAIAAYCCACMKTAHLRPEAFLRRKNPPHTIGDLMARVVCKTCGCRKPSYKPVFRGKRRD